MAKKYVPKEGHEIDFFYHKERHTGTINWVGSSHITVYPHTVCVKSGKGLDLDFDWVVEYGEIIGRAK